MPNITNETTIQEIARVFCGEGKRNETKTLLIVGYGKSYAETLGHKIYRNIKVIEAIAKIDAESAVKQGRTVESLDQMHQAAYNLAMSINQPSAAVSAGTAIARLYGMDKDAGVDKADQPLPLTKEELATLKREAVAIRNTAKDTA